MGFLPKQSRWRVCHFPGFFQGWMCLPQRRQGGGAWLQPEVTLHVQGVLLALQKDRQTTSIASINVWSWQGAACDGSLSTWTFSLSPRAKAGEGSTGVNESLVELDQVQQPQLVWGWGWWWRRRWGWREGEGRDEEAWRSRLKFSKSCPGKGVSLDQAIVENLIKKMILKYCQ